MCALIVEHALFLPTAAPALLAADLLALLPFSGLYALLALQYLFRQMAPGEPAVGLAAARLAASDAQAARFMAKPYDIRGFVRLLPAWASAQNETFVEILLVNRGFNHQCPYPFDGIG